MNQPLPADHLRNIVRDQERNLDRDGYVRLDRNERVTPIPEKYFREMVALLSVDVMMAYPDGGPFVSRVARTTGLPDDHITPTAGSDGGIRRIFMAFVSPGDVVQIANPTYAMYDVYTRMFQGRARRIDYGSDLRLDVDRFTDAIGPGTRMVALADPDQPTGSTIDESQLRKIVAKCATVGALCVVDEAYYPFHPLTAVPLIGEFDNLLVVRSFSKLPGAAGLRLGCVLGAPALIAGVDTVRGANEVAAISLLFGSYFLDHPEIVEEFRAQVEAGRKVLVEGARALGFTAPPCAANFQLLRCPSDLAPQALSAALKDARYLIKGGFSHPSVIDCVRVSVNAPDIMKGFVEALEAAVRAARMRARTAAV